MHNAVTVESRMMQQYRLMLQNNWKRCEAMERASGVGNQGEIMCLPALPHIPDICHLDHLHVGGEEICHVEKFQISIHGISPHEEEFQFFHTTDVEKCEFLPNLVKFHISPQDRCEEI